MSTYDIYGFLDREMERDTLGRMLDASYHKASLKMMAIEKGLDRRVGHNGRSISQMNKHDFIRFILQRHYEHENRRIRPTGPIPAPRTIFFPSKPTIIDEEVTGDTKSLECKICTINKVCIVLTKCGHVFCYSCTQRFDNKCATCRTTFTSENTIRLFF